MHCLEAKTIRIVPLIDPIGIPIGPKGVNRRDVVAFSKWCGYNPIFTSLQDHNHCPKAFRVHVKWTDCTFPPNERPLQVRLDVGNLECCFVLRRKSGLGHFMRCEAPELTWDVEVPVVSRQRDRVDWRALLTRQGGGLLMKLPQCRLVKSDLGVIRIHAGGN